MDTNPVKNPVYFHCKICKKKLSEGFYEEIKAPLIMSMYSIRLQVCFEGLCQTGRAMGASTAAFESRAEQSTLFSKPEHLVDRKR